MWRPGERDHLENLGVAESVIFFCKLRPVVVYHIRTDLVLPSATTDFIRVS